MPSADKLILSVQSVLRDKYKERFSGILTLLQNWVSSDRKKGLNTQLIFLDDGKKMSSFRIRCIQPGKSKEADYKFCVDALYKYFNPAYICLFGAVDVFPQQRLYNPLFKTDHEDDRWVPSDLPYACNEPYSRDPNNFLFPVRVVGRLADINGVADMDLVTTSVNNIIAFTPKSKSLYQSYFAASVPMWRLSTDESVALVFQEQTRVNLVPPKSDHWTLKQLKPLSHFFNCHGAAGEPYWYGQKNKRYPKAMSSTLLAGKIGKNTIVAAECCYGADMYAPAIDKLPHSMPICNAYFKNGAIAMVGSSTIAYGPATTNDQADLITQYFMMNILGGASTGRAMLEARQKYILNHGPDLSPTDLKTIAQFNLLGDPSLQIVTGKADLQKKSTGVKTGPLYEDISRADRRKYLLSKGIALRDFVNHLLPAKKLDAGKKARAQMNKLIGEFKLTGATGKTYKIRQNAVNRKTFRSGDMLTAKYHVFLENKTPGSFSQKLLSIKELDGRIVDVKLFQRK